ncbi:MAG: universal stress protein [Ferruginibacter sp.]|nr:universal stress protein [Ferruginibacter sp.]
MKSFDITRILVPIDFSNNSMNALQTAVAIAKRHKADLKLLHVFDLDNTLYPEDNMGSNSDPDIAIVSLGRLAASVKNGDGVSCGIVYKSGFIPNTILQTAKEKNSDLIVMGKNGNAGYREHYAGTNTYNVIKKSHCPVLSVVAGKMYENFTDVLFPARPVVSVFEKYELIRPIILKNKATLHFLGLRNPDYIEELHIISKLTEIFKKQASADEFNTTMNYYFKDDKFAAHLLDTIKKGEYPYDLLVISAELDNNIKDYYLGDYAQQLIHQAQIPVLILRATETISSKAEVLRIIENSFQETELSSTH